MTSQLQRRILMSKILIIDDDKDFVDATSIVLNTDGHEVHSELSATKAMESVNNLQPDLLILDVMFPENPSYGFELAKKLRKDNNSMPIIMLTAINEKFPLGFNQDHTDESWLPVESFLDKPIDLDVLKDKVSELLERH